MGEGEGEEKTNSRDTTSLFLPSDVVVEYGGYGGKKWEL